MITSKLCFSPWWMSRCCLTAQFTKALAQVPSETRPAAARGQVEQGDLRCYLVP